jgi:hypothetical protein
MNIKREMFLSFSGFLCWKQAMVRKCRCKRLFQMQPLGKARRWEDNINMNITEVFCEVGGIERGNCVS